MTSHVRQALVLGVIVLGGCSARASDLAEGQAALRAGKYEEAIQLLTRLAAKDPDPRVHRTLVRALGEIGRYEEASEVARRFNATHAESSELSNALGEILRSMGRTDEAGGAFTRAVNGRASDQLSAEANRAVLRLESGDRAAAREGLRRLVEAYNRRSRMSSEDMTAVGTACRYLGVDNPALFKDALKAFDEAIAADPGNLEPRVRLAELFLQKYNSADAQATLEQVLKVNPRHPRALLGQARRMDFDGEFGALDKVRLSLEVNPRLVAARVFLASMLLGLEQPAEAAAEVTRALETNPNSIEALALMAATRFLRGDKPGFEQARVQALARNPHSAELYTTLAELSVQNRLYSEAVGFAAQAVALDPTSWHGLGLLGLNQLRIGAIAEGRRSLEASFAGDPYDVWIKNTLDLLDTFKDYRETKSPRFVFMVDRKESDLLSPYLAELGEEALDRLSLRYGYRPDPPVRLEVYRSHADFSVRTVGLAGLGALGVSFGNVLAIDSPSAREVGQFNWGSTLWHELTHTITLGMTDHKVPRWFSEGLSVHEEHRARPGWGDDVSVDFLIAAKQGRLLPVAQLNNGFVRPRSPAQIPVSYYQASLVCELIERDHGFPAVLDMLRGYREGLTTSEVFARALGTSLEAFDQRFDAELKRRFGGALAALRVPAGDAPPPTREAIAERAAKDPGDFEAQLRRGQALFEEKKSAEARPYLERAKALFPEYAQADSPRLFLAAIHKEKEEWARAAEELSQLTAINESHYRAHLDLASLRGKLHDPAGAAAALEGSLYIHPLDGDVHNQLASLYTAVGERKKAVRERRAVVALAPVDLPEALYQLAEAQLAAGDSAAARREVLRALEQAPRFEKAQDLLLKLSRRP